MSNVKVLYILGAGASAEVIPPYSPIPGNRDLNQALRDLINKLEDVVSKNETKFIDFTNSLISGFRILLQNSYKFGSADTYIKYLWISNHPQLSTYKQFLSYFFVYQQSCSTDNLDSRVIPFLVSLFDKNLKLPNNVSILSWNYDSQIEIAYETIVKSPNKQIKDDLNFFHLNGCAGNFISIGGEATNKIKIDIDIVAYIERIFDIRRDDYQNQISFAWEHNSPETDFLINDIVDTTHLVIIGYSFPFFNRKTDKAIFSKILSTQKLTDIYFQDPKRNGQFLYNQFNIPKTVTIHHEPFTERYLIPHEL